jgi:two-component system, chemotaxis family, chemotaxis protein CheY
MPKKILVVDDDPTGRLLMEARLTKAGYEVLQAADGEMGLNLTKMQKPDLIVLDIEMPGMNGFSFVIELKKLEDVKDTPIIVLTAHEENKPIFHRKGIDNYLVKPVNFDELFTMMDKILGPSQ